MPDQDKEHPISPDIVHFENVLDRLVYVQTISIRNYADKARRVEAERRRIERSQAEWLLRAILVLRRLLLTRLQLKLPPQGEIKLLHS